MKAETVKIEGGKQYFIDLVGRAYCASFGKLYIKAIFQHGWREVQCL